MSEQPEGAEYAGGPLTDEQQAFLTARQAQQAVASPSPAADAATAAAVMQAAPSGPELPAESAMDQMMELIKAQSEQLESLRSQVGVMQKQAEERSAAEGGPLVVRYAQGAADKLAALAVQHPDIEKGHFDVPLDLAAKLTDAAKLLSKDGDSAADVESAASGLDRWLTRTHWRKSGKFIDFSAVADDVDTALEEAQKLAA